MRLRRFLFLGLVVGGCARQGDSEQIAILLNEQLLMVATLIGSIAALPTLIEFLVERRKRKERIALSLEDVSLSTLNPRLAGMDDLLEGIGDLIDRACHPKEYSSLEAGNEILIVGPALSGKKSLAQVIAKRAAIARVITVYNPRNVDALAKAKSLISGEREAKIMLLLPRIDQAFEKEEEEVLTELEALIETTAGRPNVQVIGTATQLKPNGALDNLFGIKLVVPGTRQAEEMRVPPVPEMERVMAEAARFYLADAARHGFSLAEISQEQFVGRVLEVAGNAAEVEDIVTLCRTLAIYRRRVKRQAGLMIDVQMLETAISRVVVRPVSDREVD